MNKELTIFDPHRDDYKSILDATFEFRKEETDAIVNYLIDHLGTDAVDNAWEVLRIIPRHNDKCQLIAISTDKMKFETILYATDCIMCANEYLSTSKATSE